MGRATPSNVGWLTVPDRAPWWSCVLHERDFTYTYVNKAYVQCFGDRSFVGKTVFSAMADLQGQPFFDLLRRVFESGRPHHAEGPIQLQDGRTGEAYQRWIEYAYAPSRDPAGKITGIVAEGRLWDLARRGRSSLSVRIGQFGAKSLTDEELLRAFIDESSEDRSEQLLRRFGTLRGVFSASPHSIAQPLITTGGSQAPLDNASTERVLVAREIYRRVLLQKIRERPLLSTHTLVHGYLRMTLADETREQFRVLFLDTGLRLIADELMGDGTINRCAIYVREVLRRCLELSAHSLLLVHNHPSGRPTPSVDDWRITRELIIAAGALDVEVHDHLIVAGARVVSMRNLPGWR